METKERSKLGKKTRAQGKAFELKVRDDLISKGWIVSRWDNNVEFIAVSNGGDDYIYESITGKKIGKCVSAKAKFNPFTKSVMNMSGGFPDFVVYRKSDIIRIDDLIPYAVWFVESKMTGKLDKEEIEKAKWYLENKYCSKFLIAKKIKKGRKVEVEYIDFNETYK